MRRVAFWVSAGLAGILAGLIFLAVYESPDSPINHGCWEDEYHIEYVTPEGNVERCLPVDDMPNLMDAGRPNG